jgi:hypothetical protein
MALVGDRERERTSALLRRHYLEGRLTVEELGERLGLALEARDHGDLRRALRRLPAGRSSALAVRETLEPALSAVHRLAVATVRALAWLLMSFVLLLLFAGWLIDNGPHLGGLLAFPAAWVALTWLLLRGGRRPRRARRPC